MHQAEARTVNLVSYTQRTIERLLTCVRVRFRPRVLSVGSVVGGTEDPGNCAGWPVTEFEPED